MAEGSDEMNEMKKMVADLTEKYAALQLEKEGCDKKVAELEARVARDNKVAFFEF